MYPNGDWERKPQYSCGESPSRERSLRHFTLSGAFRPVVSAASSCMTGTRKSRWRWPAALDRRIPVTEVRALTPEGHCRKAEFHHNLAEFSMRVTAYWSGIVGPDWYFSNRVTEMDRHSQPSRSKLLLVILQRRAHELATRAHPRL